jgi:hypothetical protein
VWAATQGTPLHGQRHGAAELRFLKQAGDLLGPVLRERFDLARQNLSVALLSEAVLAGRHESLNDIFSAASVIPGYDRLRSLSEEGGEPDRLHEAHRSAFTKVSVVILTSNHAGYIRRCWILS